MALFLAGKCNLSQELGNSYFYKNYLRVELSISGSRDLSSEWKAALLQVLHLEAWLVNSLPGKFSSHTAASAACRIKWKGRPVL